MNFFSLSDGVHKKIKFQCSECDQSYSQESHLKRHYNNNHNKATMGHKCKICPKIFKNKESLNRHKKIHEGGIFRYKCPKCPKSFSGYDEYRIKWHIKTKHPADINTPIIKIKVKNSDIEKFGRMGRGRPTYFREGP